MDIEAWLSASYGEVIGAGDLTSPPAVSFARFVDRHAADVATVGSVRRGPAGELVELTFRTGRPQKSVIPIKRTERLGIRFGEDDTGSLMRVMLRAQLNREVQALPLTVAAFKVPPEHMVRLSFAPRNLGSLAAMLSARGIDLFADLRARFGAWLDDARTNAARINSNLAVIVEMPIKAPDGAQEGTDLRAFVTAKKVGDVAVALGVAHKTETKDQGGTAGYVSALVAGVTDEAELGEIEVLPVEVHATFDRALATRIAGRTVEDERLAVIVGGGAIGAHVAPCLAREGRFRWTVIDDDVLLPHNLARHIAFAGNVTQRKSDLLAGAVASILDDESSVATAITSRVGSDEHLIEDVDRALADADLIIDASASLLAERYLSDHHAEARRISIFFSPAGNAAVLLAEPKDRSITLRELEAQYLGHVICEEGLAGHLATPVRTIAYTGACRAITNQIPEARVMALSGLVAEGLGQAADADEGVIRIWSLGEGGAVSSFSFSAEKVRCFEVDGWQIALDDGLRRRVASMRAERLSNETGGILLGVVDIPAQRIHLAGVGPEPTDSVASPGGFTRRTSGVQDVIDRVMAETQGQVRYVGEWHSHPPNAGVMPSITDLAQINWLASIFDMDTLPGLMLIAGEDEVSVVFMRQEKSPRSPAAETEN